MLNFRSINILLTSLSLVVIVAFFLEKLSLWWLLPIALAWLVITALGSGLIGLNYHFKSLNYQPNEPKNRIAITFDDGPNLEFTPKVLELLRQYNAKATFFCIGKHVEAQPNLVKQILDEGHVIGNHTYSHSNSFGVFSTQKVKAELERTNIVFEKLTGLKMKLYRPAFGVTNPKIKRAIKALQLQSIGWNKRSLDTTSRSQDIIFKRVTTDLKPGDVILLHDTSQKTVDTLEQLLLFLQKQNLKSVSIDTLFNIKAYA